MGEELRFHSPSLRSAGQGLTDAGARLRQEWQNLQQAVQGMGDMFGDDMVGSLIGMSYQAAHQMADESYTSAAEELAYFGEGLVVMAAGYEATEQGITAGLDELGRTIG